MFTAVIVTSNLFDCMFSRSVLERPKNLESLRKYEEILEQQSSVTWQYYKDMI